MTPFVRVCKQGGGFHIDEALGHHMHTVGYRDLRTRPISRNGGIMVEQGGIVDDTVASLSKVNTFSSVVGLLVFGKSVLLLVH